LTAYFISGLGADERIFEKLVLPPSLIVKHLSWIEPLKNEKLAAYCYRLSQPINTTEDFILVGLSFGGIAAVELSKILHPKQVILISSIATKEELRPLFRFIRFTKIHRIIPPAFFKWYNPLLNWAFSVKTLREKELLHSFIKSASKHYLKWSVEQVLNWRNTLRPPALFHIHGTADRILPHRFTHADVKIKGGSHLMVHNRADEISQILSARIIGISE
jgi:pimeloyl-ACP methyl ester carboxylesterase